MEKTQATVIQLFPFRETSLIVQWITPEHGIIRTVAKGARRPKSGFVGKLDLFYRLEVEFIPSRRSTLHTLKEVSILDLRLGLRDSYDQTLAASYFSKLILNVAEEDTPIPALADLLERGLDYLAARKPTPKAVRFFEKETASLLGLGERGLAGIGELYGRVPGIRKELLQRLT